VIGEQAVTPAVKPVLELRKPSPPAPLPSSGKGTKPRPAGSKKTSLRSKVEADAAPAQMPLTDYGLYKCLSCGKMVLGFDRENHSREVHQGEEQKYEKKR